jgi:putative flippase GtrA
MNTKQPLIGWLAEPVDNTLLQVPRALMVSALAAALDFGILIVLVEGVGWNPLGAACVSYLLGGVLQYVLCAVWVFPAAPENVPMGVVLFILLSLVGLGITWATMGLLHNLAHVNYALTKCVALGLAFWWNFLSRKFLLFKPAGS